MSTQQTTGVASAKSEKALPAPCNFSDSRSPGISIRAVEEKRGALVESNVQTDDIDTSSQETQSFSTREAQVQTDPDVKETSQKASTQNSSLTLSDEESEALANFLRMAEPLVHQVVEDNNRSTAFLGMAEETDEVAASTLLKRLRDRSLDHDARDFARQQQQGPTTTKKASAEKQSSQLSCVVSAWNTRGSVVAIGYADPQEQEWWTAASHLCLWNIDGRSIKENEADATIQLTSCPNSLEFHPTNVSLLAVGMTNGDVNIVDLRTNGIVGTSPFTVDSHSEGITSIHWIPRGRRELLCTTSTDGFLILWERRSEEAQLALLQRISLESSSIPAYLLPGKRAVSTGSALLGTLCSTLFYDVHAVYAFIGTEAGVVGRVNLSHVSSQPIDMAYQPHNGPVHSISVSQSASTVDTPLLATCSSDSYIHIYHHRQSAPLFTLQTTGSALLSVTFLPSRPACLLAGDAKGSIAIVDIRNNSALEVLQDEQSKAPIRQISLAAKRNKICACSDDGTARVWFLGSAITTATQNERAEMNALTQRIFSGETA